jgi:serine phosphatase RsbU (regulator of sigma subunit)
LIKPEAKFRALRLIGQELGGTLVLGEVLDRIFNSLFEIFPRAERGFVLLRDPNTDLLSPEIIRSRTGPAGDLKISKTVLNRVLNEGQAILCKDLAEEFPDSVSVSDSKIRSLMCVPLFDQNRRTVGIMQIDTRDGRGRFEQDDLDLLAAVASQISVAVQNAQLHKALLRQREMENELEFARQVMQSLLPERPASVPGYDFWAYYEPARHVGGDYYGIIPISPPDPAEGHTASRWAIAVGDVVGKGMPAALLTAKLSAEVRMFLGGNPNPVRVVEQLNHQFDSGGVLDLYITFLLVVLDINEHRLSVVNAGHPCPVIRRKNGTIEEFGRMISGLPLGIMPDYRYGTAETVLEPGETVVLYTDGVTDAMNANSDRMGESLFQDSLRRALPGAAPAGEAVVKAIQHHVADRPQFDDITLVCLSRK